MSSFNDISELVGLTFSEIKRDKGKFEDECIIFKTDTGRTFKMHHAQDCCESVYIDDIVGDLEDLIGTPIITATESYNHPENSECESCTWTFYNFATIKGYVTIKWYGVSNGYYSEEACIIETTHKWYES